MLALGRMALTVGMMYLFWIMESLSSIAGFGGHGHSHGPQPSAPAVNNDLGNVVYYESIV